MLDYIYDFIRRNMFHSFGSDRFQILIHRVSTMQSTSVVSDANIKLKSTLYLI